MYPKNEDNSLDFPELHRITFEDKNTIEALLQHLFAIRPFLIKSIEDEQVRERHPPSRRIFAAALLDHDVAIIRLLKMLQDRNGMLTDRHRDFFNTFDGHWHSLTVSGYRAHHYFDWASLWDGKSVQK